MSWPEINFLFNVLEIMLEVALLFALIASQRQRTRITRKFIEDHLGKDAEKLNGEKVSDRS